MPEILVKYGGHISLTTGKMEETCQLNGATVMNLIDELDVKYPGFKEMFVPPHYGIMNMRTAIFLRRPGQPAQPILDPGFELHDGDCLLMW
jgi:hypothetical protein